MSDKTTVFEWVVGGGAVILALGSAGCTCSSSSPADGSKPSASVAVAPQVAAPTTPVTPTYEALPTSWPVPTGPFLQILPGQGVGPIRMGATVATIERLMEAPCEFKTEDSCRYVGHAVEFFLKDGVLAEVRAYRPGRPAKPEGRTYGAFNGGIPPRVAFGMLPFAVKEVLGEPLRTEPIADGGTTHVVEVDIYKGMRLEYDRLPNGNPVLAEVIVRKPD